MNRRAFACLLAFSIMLATTSDASAGHTRLLVVNRLVRHAARVTYVSTDAAAGLSKGAATGVDTIAADVFLETDGGIVTFSMPVGAYGDGAGWTVNDATHAAFVNSDAPSGMTGVMRTVFAVGRRVKLVAKSLGDASPFVLATAPSSSLAVAYVVTNGGETAMHCTRFAPTNCTYSSLDGGSGWKLRCQDGGADPLCGAVPTTTTTTTLAPGVCGNGIRESGEQCDGGPACTADCFLTLASCCAGAWQCVAAPIFTLQYYLSQWCSAQLPGSTSVPGQICRDDGTCGDQTIDAVPLCCQQTATTCYDGVGSSVAGLWYFQYYCLDGAGLGNGPYMAINSACDAGGTCVSQ